VDLGLVTQAQFDSLVRYREPGQLRLHVLHIFHFTWMSPRYNWFREDVEHNCNKSGSLFIASVQGKSMMRHWWNQYICKSRVRLNKRPWVETFASGDFFDKALKDGSLCTVCQKDLDRDFRQFTNLFASTIDDAVVTGKICL
ncbi:hypothetical protein L208DRAFT_1049134, partial [Tricholoma matsutake]